MKKTMKWYSCFGVIIFMLGYISFGEARAMTLNDTSTIRIRHIANDFAIAALDDPAWKAAAIMTTSKDWLGKDAPRRRQFSTQLMWSDTAIYVRFEANQNEPLIVADKPDLTKKTRGLWDRDVCEIFIAPNIENRNKYFEFEIAPTGEWIDLGIHKTATERLTDWDYSSGMQSAVRIEKTKIVMAIKIEWKAFGKAPNVGDVWLGNLFRCVGVGPTRGYLAWQPTRTIEPAFHIPEAFGEFWFVNAT